MVVSRVCETRETLRQSGIASIMQLEHLRHALDERRIGTMPKHTEPQANGELRRLLDRMLPAYNVTAENTQQI